MGMQGDFYQLLKAQGYQLGNSVQTGVAQELTSATTILAFKYRDGVLVAGMGPAGFSLSHQLMNDGHSVVGIDGLKIESLPEHLSGVREDGSRVPFAPIHDIHDLYESLDQRVMAGFGGVAEYGITVRWNKNFLKVIRLLLERRDSFALIGGVRFGGTLTLDDAWRKIPATLQRDARVAAAAAEGYLASNAEDNAQVRAAEVIEQALAASWDSDLAGLYAACNTGTSQIERAERWLAAHPNDATLLLTLGRLCAREKLWGKARNYLDASLSVEPTHNAYLASAQLYEQLGDNDAAQKHYRKSLEQALARLHRANVAG